VRSEARGGSVDRGSQLPEVVVVVPVTASIAFEGVGPAPHPNLTAIRRDDESIPDLRKDQLPTGTPDLRGVHVHT
jgi:hypothetical protein